MIDGILVGPVAGLALAIVMLGLFYTGKIMPRNTVPREDFKAQQDIIATYASALTTLTTSVDALVTTVKLLQRQNGGR